MRSEAQNWSGGRVWVLAAQSTPPGRTVRPFTARYVHPQWPKTAILAEIRGNNREKRVVTGRELLSRRPQPPGRHGKFCPTRRIRRRRTSAVKVQQHRTRAATRCALRRRGAANRPQRSSISVWEEGYRSFCGNMTQPGLFSRRESCYWDR